MSYKILSIYSHKGGVGKTTLADALSAAVCTVNETESNEQLNFRRCLVIDVDSQMNLTRKMLETQHNFNEYRDHLHDINDFDANIVNPDIKTKLTRLSRHDTDVNPNPIVMAEERGGRGRRVDLLPGYPELEHITRKMALELDHPFDPLVSCLNLKNLIDEYAKKFRYDLIILDLGTNLHTFNCVALWTSDYMLIPVITDMYCQTSFEMIRETVFPKDASDTTHPYNRFRSKLRVLGFVTNMVKYRMDNPVRPQSKSVDMMEEEFIQHLGPFFTGVATFEGAPGTHPCTIPHLNTEMVGHEDCPLQDLAIHNARTRRHLLENFDKLIRWLNRVMV